MEKVFIYCHLIKKTHCTQTEIYDFFIIILMVMTYSLGK